MKKTKLTYFFGVIAFGAAMVSHSAPVSEEMACTVASGFLTKNSVAKSVLEGRTVDSVEAYENLWVANLSPSGHIIISGSTKCKPICSFSPSDFAEPADDTAQMDMFESWIERCSEKESDETLEENAGWAKYSAETPNKRRLKSASISLNTSGATIVGPLIGSNWHQGAPYNDLSPLNSVPCGCSATAGGQELYYWKWPHRMENDFTFVHTLNGVANSYTNRMNGLVPFDWDKMRDSYKDANGKDITTFRADDKASTYAAAHLVNWVQTFVHMLLSDGASGAPAKLNASVMTNEWYEAGYSLGKWENGVSDFSKLWTAITNDIAFGSPINVNAPRHQMVVEGYALDSDNQEFICLNYGWGSKGSWVDLENEIDNGGAGGNLAHFQIGFRPKKRVQFDIVPKVSRDSVELVWYLPHCYTNRIDGFKRVVSTNGIIAASMTIEAIANQTVYTNFVNLATEYSGDVTITVTPIMKEGEGEGRPTSVTTTIGTPHGMPGFESISAIGGGIELMQDGFFVECGRGITNKITVTCSEATTGLKALPTHLSVVPDSWVSVVTNGNVFTVHVDATAMNPMWDGDMILLTLVASNDDGTEVAKNLMLRFNSTRNILDGTFNVVEDCEASDPIWLCGSDTVIDAKGKAITYKSNSFMGTGTVTLTNSVSGGSFTFEGLDYFNGTLKWISTGGVTVNVHSNCNVEFEGDWRYAVRDSVTPSKVAPVPLAVWSGDFTTTQEGYTLNLCDNALSQDNSTITINQDVGVKVDFTTGITAGMTVMFKYANLELAHTNTLVTSYVSGGDENRTGVYLDSAKTANGIWLTSGTYNTNADRKTVGDEMLSGTMAFYYGNGNGTTLHYVNGTSCRRIFRCSSLVASSDNTIHGCSIGGERAKTNATLFPAATGLQITGIAIFGGQLTREQMAAYIWPAEIKKLAITNEHTTVSYLNTQIAAATSSGFRVMEIDIEAGTTISVDAAFSAAIPVSVKSEGNITLSAESMCDASYFNNIDFTGVKGAVLRSWLAAGVVGFNFYSTKGRNTSAALVSGAWYENLTDKDGTSTEMFADGLSALTWSSSNCYGYNEATLLNGYLDDGANGGNGVTVKLSNVPYEIYDVVIYASTDTENVDFTAKTVNGKTYTWDVNTSSVVEGNASWGRSRYDTPEYGTNALYIAGLSGPLTIYGTARNGNHRGGIAAIQVMPPYYTLTIDDNCKWSDGAWTIATGESIDYVPAGGRVKIVANKAATLTIDSNVSIDDLVIIGDHKEDISFNIQPGVTFALYKELDMPVLNFTGGGTVFCSCSDSLKGIVKGSCVIEYAEGLLPDSGVVFTDSEWTGTNVFTNCGNSNNSAHRYVDLSQLGNNNSFLKMPGFNGYLADDKICSATLVIDEGTEFNISNGDSNHHNSFRKVVGEGTFKISGDQTATTQVVVRDVSEFIGAFDMMGKGHKSIVVGAPDDWTYDYTTYRQKVVVAGPVTIASGKTWNAADSQGVVVLSSGTLIFGGAGASIYGRLTLKDGATIKLPTDTVFPYRLATGGELPAVGTVNFYVGETDYTGSLSFSDGVVSVKSDVVVCATISEEGDPVAWDDLDWNLNYPEALTNQVTAYANRTLNFGVDGTANTVVFNVSEGSTLTLDGSLTAANIVAGGILTLTPTSVVNAASLVLTNGVLKLEMTDGHSPTLAISGTANLTNSIIWVSLAGGMTPDVRIPLMSAGSFSGIESTELYGLDSGWRFEVDGDTLYATSAIASITVNDETTYYASLAAATNAANGNVITLLTNTDEAIVIPAGQTVKIARGDFTCNNVTIANVAANVSSNTVDGVTTYTSDVAKAAIIGDTIIYYSSLSNAVEAASDSSSVTNTVRLLATDPDNVSLNNKTIIFEENGNRFVGAFTGNGTLIITNAPNTTTWSPSKFNPSWIGEFVCGWTHTNGDFDLTKYGSSQSTITLKSMTGGQFAKDTSEGTANYSGTVNIAGSVTTGNGYGDQSNPFNWGKMTTFDKLLLATGGELNLTWKTGSQGVGFRINTLYPRGGRITLAENGKTHLRIDTVNLTAEPTINTRIVPIIAKGSHVYNNDSPPMTNGLIKVTVTADGKTTESTKKLFFTNDGLYVAVASVNANCYTNLFGAIGAAGLDDVITLHASTDEEFTVLAGETLLIRKNGFSCDNVTIAQNAANASSNTVDGVTTYTSNIAIASVDGHYYATLSEAIAAANGRVITLHADTTEKIELAAGQTVKIAKGDFSCDNVSIASLSADSAITTDADCVTTYTSVVAKAAIGTTYYVSLADAVTGAVSAATNAVRLLADDGSAVLLSGKTIIFEENGCAFSGTLSGNGTIIVTNAPSATTWLSDRFVANSWTGAFVLKNIVLKSFSPSSYGTTNSTVRVIGCSGDFAEGAFNGTLDLQDEGEAKAFTITDATSGKTTTFAKVVGLGTFDANMHSSQKFEFMDPTEFEGALTLGSTNSKINLVLGQETTGQNGQISIATNATIAANKTWSAPNGVNVLGPGTLRVDGTGSVVGGLTFAAGSTVRYVGEQSAAESIRLISADSFTGVENAAIEGLDGYYLEVVDGILYASKEPVPINTNLTAIYGPQAVAVWDGNFSTNALVAYSSAGYTLVNSNATHGLRMSSVTIDQDNQGLMFDSKNAMSGLTVLVRYSNLTVGGSGTNRVLFTSSVTSTHQYDRAGIQLKSDGKLVGLWNSSTASNNNNDNGTASGSIPSSGVMAFTYSTAGTYLYYGATAKNIQDDPVWGSSGLKSKDDAAIYGAGIGGMYRDGSKSGAEAAKGMVIEAVAVFNSVLSVKDMNGFIWPSYEIVTINVSGETSVSQLNFSIADSMADAAVVNAADGTTINFDVAFPSTVPVVIRSNGNLTLSSESQPDASSFTKVDFSGVKGSIFRSWFADTVVGFNFRSANGNDVSGALVACDNWIHDNNSASGSSTALFSDGLSKLSWSSANTWACSGSTIVSGYLDDGENGGYGAAVTLSNVPYETYDVVIYCSSDSNPGTFLAKTVNNTTYTWDFNSGEALEGDSDWGKAALSMPVYGVNAMRIKELSGPLTIYGGKRNGGKRGGIAAIQIMPTNALDVVRKYKLTLDGTAMDWSEGAWTLNGEDINYAPTSGTVEIEATESTALTIDMAVSLAELTVKGNTNIVINVATNGVGGSLYAIKTTIESGVFQQGSEAVLGETPFVAVKDGATFDLNGLAVNGGNAFLIEGVGAGMWPWALTSSSGDFPVNTLKTITLTGNATIGGDNKINFGNTGVACSLDLGGYTLTKTGVGELAFTNGRCKSGTNGTIDITEGVVSVNYWCNLDGSNLDGQYANTTVILRDGAELKNSTDRAIIVDTLRWLGGNITGNNSFAVATAFEGGGTVVRLWLLNNVVVTVNDNLNVETLTLDSNSNGGADPAPSIVRGSGVDGNATLNIGNLKAPNTATISVGDNTVVEIANVLCDTLPDVDTLVVGASIGTGDNKGSIPSSWVTVGDDKVKLKYKTVGGVSGLYASQLTVNFEPGEHGSLGGDVSSAVSYGDVVTPPTVTPDAGYYFERWDGGDIDATITDDITFVAQYAPVVYDITYEGLKSASNPNPTTYTIEDEITFLAPGEVYGWVFKGWSSATISLGSTGNITVFANWERRQFDVTVNGETVQYDYEQSVTFHAPSDPVSQDASMQVLAVGTTYDGIGVASEFKREITGPMSFAWDIYATNYWFASSVAGEGVIANAPANGWLPDGTNFMLTAVADDQYHFVEWTGDTYDCTTNGNQIEVTMDRARTIGATFAIDQYTVKFVDEDGTGLSSASYDYGTAAADIVKPADPTKAATAQYTYTFNGWSPEVENVTSNATYTATYSSTINQYTVTFVDENGTGLSSASYDYGTAAADIVKPADPTKAATAQYTYTFNGWSPTVADVTGDATYTATYSSTLNTYAVTVGCVETNVEYGASVTFKAPTVAVSEKEQDIQVWAVGTTYNNIGVTNEVAISVTGEVSFDWDIYATNYWFATSAIEHGSITGAPANGWLPDGTNFTLTAVADDGYAFTGWTGDTIGCSESGASLTVTMNRKRTIGATFEKTTGYTISPKVNWFAEEVPIDVDSPQTTGASFDGSPSVEGGSLNVDTEHGSPLFYVPPTFSGSATAYRIETVIKELAVNASTNALPIYEGEGNIPYASIAAATSDDGPNYWYAWNGATWTNLNETIHPSDGGPYTNVIEFTVNDSKLNVAYSVNGESLGTVEHASATKLPSLSKLGFSGYGKFGSFSGDGTEASLTLMTTKSLDELIDAGLMTNGFESVESALAHKDDSGLYGWQKMVLGMSSNSDEKLFAAPVQNASPTSLSFKLGNYRTNSNFSNMTAKFQVYEVTNTGAAVENGLTSGEEFVDVRNAASVDLSDVKKVKFFRIKIRFE